MAALGVLDWGIGGLGFVQALWQRAPHLPILYLSDSGTTPYGKLSARELAQRVEQAVATLHAAGADEVVIACNAASSVVSRVRSRVPLTPIIAAGCACIPESFTGTLWVLGGARIVRSRLYNHALSRPGRSVHGRVAQPISAHIEAGTTDTPEFMRALETVLTPVRDGDALLLACTHYPAVAPEFRKLRPSSAIFDPAPTLSRVVAERRPLTCGPSRFLTTGSAADMARAAQTAWGMRLPDVAHLSLGE